MLIRALASQYRPVAAHLIPVRRCNLSCAYCNEYDDHSQPVATADMFRRVDRLAVLGTGILTLSGGEPLLHPELDEIIRRIRSRGMIATLISNGYLLTQKRIVQLNRAGLDHLQISIDNVIPDDVSKKSLKVLDQKLRWLASGAAFDVTVNSVVGGGIRESRRCTYDCPPGTLARDSRPRSASFMTEAAGCGRWMTRSDASSSKSSRSATRRSTSRTTTGFRRTWRMGRRTTGIARLVAVTSTSAKTVSSTGVRNSEAILAFPSNDTVRTTCGANIIGRNGARHCARSAACTE